VRLGKADWSSWGRAIEKEWLLTNGIGGFSSSTVVGGNSRRYHGLLIASLKPPVQRHLILSQLHETVTAGGREYDLHSFSTGDYVKKGFNHLQSFELNPLPVFTYNIGDILIEKTITMVYGQNTVAVIYRVLSGTEKLSIRLTPLVNFRDYHSDSSHRNMKFEQKSDRDGTCIKPDGLDLDITLRCRGSSYIPVENCWFENMFYAVEQERGLHAYEDHYMPGSFEISVEAGSEQVFTFIGTVEKDRDYSDGQLLVVAEKVRLASLTAKAGYEDEFACALVRAADNFIAYRESTDSKTILAGYPWFTDWGRDAMISLCGLTLSTGRYDDAAQILGTFCEYIEYGLIPNMFPDEGGVPGYNTVDAALWYFEAVNKYVQYSGDYEFVERQLYRSMVQIYDAFKKGTLHNIHMDVDGLIIAGDENTQLTWMDAKMGSAVFTPRHGKAVEINALWYNALKIMEQLAGKFGLDTASYTLLAEVVKNSFKKVFWYEDGKYLYDVVNGGFSDDSVRPNQIFAVSLSHPVIEGVEARCCVEKVWKELYTAYGLRSLSPLSPQYRAQCTGDQFARDSAYHQGTVWAWLAGPFTTAFAATLGKEPEYGGMTARLLEPFRDHLQNACLGNISEIFDADEPLIPRGCYAQAWSVAEVLRAYTEHVLHAGAGYFVL
jgi:predicted glycogen debranching enzyme